MAPYLSLLPVRKTKLPIPSLPRPTSSHSTNNQPTLQPLQPTQATVDLDQSLLDFGSLLGGQEEEEHSFGLLNDEEVPEFLADESMWTVGGRTPAKKGLQVLEGLEEEEEEEEEDQVEKGIARYDDSEDEIRRSPSPQPTDKTLSPNSTSPFPRPASTPSFRQSPASQGQALFDESMAMGNYSSNSNQSGSFAREEEGGDSTFTFDKDRPIVPEAPSVEVEKVDQDAELEEDLVHEKGEEEISKIEGFETEVNESLDKVNSMTLDGSTTEEVQQDQEVFAEETDGQVSEERLGQAEEKVIAKSEDIFTRGQEECTVQETEYSDPPEETLEDLAEEAESEIGMIEADGQNLADEESGSEREESDAGRDMDEVVPVNFNVGEASSVIQDQGNEENPVEQVVEIAQPVEITQPAQPTSASVPPPPPLPLRRRSSVAPLPSATLPTPVGPHPIPSKVRPRPSFSSAPLPTKRARHSIAASRPAHILPPDHPAHRRRQSVANIKSSAEQEGRSGRNERVKQAGSSARDVEETGVRAEKTASPELKDQIELTVPSNDSNSAQSSSARLATLEPQHDLPPSVSDSHFSIDSDVDQFPTETAQQPISKSLPTLSSTATTPPAQPDLSLPLSPDSHEPTSFEGDLTLPMMGAPLSFNPSSLEIGHSTPARIRPQSSLRSEEEEGFGRRNGLKLAGMAIETIEEVTEEETSFEIVRDRSAEVGAEMVMQIKEEEGSEEVEASEANTMEVELEEQPLVDDRQSSPVSLTQPATATFPSLAPQSTTSNAAASDEAAVSLSPERPPRRAARISLAPPLPAEPVPQVPVLRPIETSTVNTNPFNYAQSQSIPKKRSVRVSLAAPPSQPLRTKTARRASTSALSSQSTVSRREREGRPVRVSLAPPTQSESTSKRRSSVHRDSVSPAINPRLAAATASTAQEEVDVLPRPNELASPAQIPVAEGFIPAEALMAARIEEEESPSALVASTSKVPLPSTSPHAIPAPLPASATSSKHATLTLPTTFSFASTSNSLTREQERQRRKEERERRERRVEEALRAKKRGMQRGAGWKKPDTKSAKDVKGKRKEVERENKRPRLATSSNGSTRSRPPALHASKPSSVTQDSSRPTEPHQPLPPPVPSISSSVVTHIEAPGQSTSSPILKLTKATLEANRVAAGPRIDLKRRVSTFLEGIEEESRVSTTMSRDERPEEAFRDEPELEQEMPADEPLELQPTETPEEVARHLPARQAPPAPPAPAPPPVVSRPVSQNATRPVTSKPPSSRPIAAAPTRRAPSIKTTAAKPFTFAAPRSRPAPSAPSSNAGTTSPMFSERLSAWKAREQETIGKGKRKAPPPMPFKTNEIQPARPTPLNGTSPPAPTAKRPRVAPPVAEQGRKGKENAPSQRPIGTEKQKPVGKPVMISGGVAEEMEKRLKEKLEWSERQKKREEEVKRRREEARMSEADRERQKLQALRSSLSTDRRSTAASQAVAPPRGRSNPVGRV